MHRVRAALCEAQPALELPLPATVAASRAKVRPALRGKGGIGGLRGEAQGVPHKNAPCTVQRSRIGVCQARGRFHGDVRPLPEEHVAQDDTGGSREREKEVR